jgi:hypothetical protein
MNPGMRTCYLVVSRDDGTEDPPIRYNVLWGEEPMIFDVDGAPNTVAGGKVTCVGLEG